MIRELQLIELGQRGSARRSGPLDDEARALRSDLEWLRDDFGGHTEWSGGVAPADGTGEMAAELRGDAASRMHRTLARFDELNRLSDQGHLLTEAATPEMMRMLQWVTDELDGQLDEGREPRPYTFD
jgi:hypothetical protein